MKVIVAICALSLALPVFAGEWPAKGDVVYVSAELKTVVYGYLAMGGSPTQTTIAACEPFTVKKYRTGKLLRLRDRAGNLPTLKGEWSVLVHPTEDSCRTYYEEHGQPFVQAAWMDFKLVEQSHD